MEVSNRSRTQRSRMLLQILLVATLLLGYVHPVLAVEPDTGPTGPTQADAAVLSVGASASPSLVSGGGLVT